MSIILTLLAPPLLPPVLLSPLLGRGVGGLTPPLVSRGGEEEWEMIIPTGGSPTLDGRGCPTSPPTRLRFYLTDSVRLKSSTQLG